MGEFLPRYSETILMYMWSVGPTTNSQVHWSVLQSIQVCQLLSVSNTGL